LVDQHASFIKTPANSVVEEALKHVFAKDHDFQEYLKLREAHGLRRCFAFVASTNDGAESTVKKPVSVVPSAPKASAVMAGLRV
jgi:hypothetical protein